MRNPVEIKMLELKRFNSVEKKTVKRYRYRLSMADKFVWRVAFTEERKYSISFSIFASVSRDGEKC